MTTDQFFWVLARVAGLSSYAALAVALITGIALRSAVLDWMGSNRTLRALHEYTTVLWIPLAVIHLLSLLLDKTARIGWLAAATALAPTLPAPNTITSTRRQPPPLLKARARIVTAAPAPRTSRKVVLMTETVADCSGSRRCCRL